MMVEEYFEGLLLEDMKKGVGSVLDGSLYEWENKYLSPHKVIEHLKKLGKETQQRVNEGYGNSESSDGFYWLEISLGEELYCVAGSGRDGGVSFWKDKDE